MVGKHGVIHLVGFSVLLCCFTLSMLCQSQISFLLCFKRVLQNISPPGYIEARYVLFANQWVFQLEVWLLPSLILVYLIHFVLAVLSLTLYCCLWLPEYMFAGSSAGPSSTSFKEAVALLIMKCNLLCFNFVAMLKACRLTGIMR